MVFVEYLAEAAKNRFWGQLPFTWLRARNGPQVTPHGSEMECY